MLKEIKENIWEVEKEGKMLVPGRVFASKKLLGSIDNDKTVQQIKNVASLPGIKVASMAMPDAHQGYGFPIGGVAAFDKDEGIVSPGGVGYDINCGVRLLVSPITKDKIENNVEKIVKLLDKEIPSGFGKSNGLKLDNAEFNEILSEGIDWTVKNGYASRMDKRRTEDNGKIIGANPLLVSPRARERGKSQLGTLGSGNHFLEIQFVEKIFDKKVAKIFGIHEVGQVSCMVHCGSRGLGHQVASDYIQKMESEYGFEHLPDRELACAPLNSKLGKEYLSAMAAAANFAFVNRQMISFKIREVFSRFFPKDSFELVYDIAHNIAKYEKHYISGKKQDVCIHRKGATRSFGPGRLEIPTDYRKVGCPILLPGSMGTYSYVLVGTKKAEELSLASTAHGAGRVLSRSYANENITLEDVQAQMKKKKIFLLAKSPKGAVEEAPEAYKDVDEVARVSDRLGLGKIVARLRPIAVIKG